MAWEVVVGIETHAQLATKSKMFSGAATAFGAPPNSQACAVDIALPGVLPVANAAAVAMAVKFGLAVGGRINARSVFARKNYFYPDLPKGYQISQYEVPIVVGGEVRIRTRIGDKAVRLTRAHLEEDAGKSIHGESLSGVVGRGVVGAMVVGRPTADQERDLSEYSGIDLNRAGTPLIEIVSEPELLGAEEAVAYARALHALVRWIGICDGNMQEGSFRCDANVSVRRKGEKKLGTRCEIKNLNSFRFMEQAIKYEARRQIELLEDGGTVLQETRLFDSEKGETRSMRTKEEAHDYRYFPDPDLLPLAVSEEFIQQQRELLTRIGTPEKRLIEYSLRYGLDTDDLRQLTEDREISEYFEAIVDDPSLESFERSAVAKMAANFVNGELAAALAREGITISDSPVRPTALAGLIRLVLANDLPISTAKKQLHTIWSESRRRVSEAFRNIGPHPKLDGAVLSEILNLDVPVGEWRHTAVASVTASGLWPMEDTSRLEAICESVISANPKQVEDYRAGKDKAFNALVGQVMKATQGKANPAQVNEILKRRLGG